MADGGVSEGAAAEGAKAGSEAAAASETAGGGLTASEGVAAAAPAYEGGGVAAGSGFGGAVPTTGGGLTVGSSGGLAASAPAFEGAGLSAGTGFAGADGIGTGLTVGNGLGSGVGAALPEFGGAGVAAGSNAPTFLQSVGQWLTSGDKVLGMTPGQWAQQAAIQGGSALLKSNAEAQQAKARANAVTSYRGVNDALAARQEQQFADAATNWGNFTTDMNNSATSLKNQYDATKPSFGFVGSNAVESTPDVVKNDLTDKAGQTNAYTNARANAAADLNSVGTLMTLNKNKTAGSNQQIGLLGDVSKAGEAGFQNALSASALKGQTSSAAGNLISGMGNLLLASQLTKK